MRNIIKNANGSTTLILHLKEDERKRLKKLSKSMGMNDFEAIKYAIQLVAWWSKNEIEPETEEDDTVSSALQG